MDNISEFYNSILNINGKDKEEEIKRIVREEKEDLSGRTDELNGFCKYLANQIKCRINEEMSGVHAYQIDLNDFNLVDHTIIIVEYMTNSRMKRLLIDPSFIQFVKKENTELVKLDKWPSDIIDKNTMINLLKHGVVEVNNLSFNNYLESFSGGVIINFNLDEYLLESRIGKKI